jgi:hypothetical protein
MLKPWYPCGYLKKNQISDPDHSDCGNYFRVFPRNLVFGVTYMFGKSALAEHVCYTKHENSWENSKVITTNNRYGQRLCLEAWHINLSYVLFSLGNNIW